MVAENSKPKKDAANHPLYFDMIATAIKTLKERKGSSRQAILKYMKANYSVGSNVDSCVKNTLKRNVVSGRILQSTGVGASGSFKLPASVKKPTAKKVVTKKAATKKNAKKSPSPKKPAAKKPAAKKPAAKKTAAKKTPVKSKPTKKRSATKKKTPVKKPAMKKGAKKSKK